MEKEMSMPLSCTDPVCMLYVFAVRACVCMSCVLEHAGMCLCACMYV